MLNDESDADVAKLESKPEQASKRRGTKSDTAVNSGEPSDTSHVEGEKEEAEKQHEVHSSSVKSPLMKQIIHQKQKKTKLPLKVRLRMFLPLRHLKVTAFQMKDFKKPVRSLKNKLFKKTKSPLKKPIPHPKAVVAKEVKLPATIDEAGDGGATSDSDDKPLRKHNKKVDTGSSGAKSSKQSRKKSNQACKKMDVGELDGKEGKTG